MQNKVIVLTGPTGSGKTDWAKKIALKYHGKIISADSRQVYKGLDIGTAKETGFHQDLIDIITPDKTFSVAEYQKLAQALINEYLKANFLPIIVGGTGLYIEAVIYGYVIPGLQSQSDELRQKLETEKVANLYQKLHKIDPTSAAKIDPQNKRRIIRALEVSILSKELFSRLQKKQKPQYRTLMIGIKKDRETLYSKVDARVDSMIKNGLVEEVRTLTSKYRSDLPSLNTIGYKEIIDYLQGKISLKDAVEKIKTNTHAYIRRQDTWFKRDKNIKWVSSYQEAEKLINKFLKR